jgi:hypothetical protein
MRLDGKSLEQWLEESESGFEINGKQIKFFSLYEGLKKFLFPKHEETTKGAIISDIEGQIKKLAEKEKGSKDELFRLEKVNWLNDHGPRHIDAVIKRAGQMLDNSNEDLTPREVFCLLSAIQLHDLGNFYGRVGHEQKIMEVVAEGKSHIGSDHIERKHILQIAEVHGGKSQGTNDKDTISKLKDQAPVLDEIIRLRLVASLVRFADELADDRFRADVNLLKEKKLPKSSEVYHAYSACLSSVLVDQTTQTIELHFDIDKEFLSEAIGKDDSDIFLIEEIYNRVLKMHQERIYCARFWKSHLSIESILVIINFYSDDIHEEVHPEITFTLSERGYPQGNQTIYEMCPQLKDNGEELNGEYFKKFIKK